MVVIAGQNGCGKSCIFDAIRLLKSVYGGYQHNEWHQWMGEFQIKLTNNMQDLALMFNDVGREFRIAVSFRLAPEERVYLAQNARDLLKESIWRLILPEAYQWGGVRMAAFTAQFRDRAPEVEERVNAALPGFMAELAKDVIVGQCFVPVNGDLFIEENAVLSVVFSTFNPQYIGVIDYHGAQRHYVRENVQGINLNLDATTEQKKQTALYNSPNKYTNVKAEMAASYVKEILSREASYQSGEEGAPESTLNSTLIELFETFFPDKKFLGPVPRKDGSLSFPVETKNGSRHDLDELSSGEKEILYGYLRIRDSAPRHSIILIDEPELHLNPRLIKELPKFYRKHLGEALGNQIWLVSHSDALLKEVVGQVGYDVYHMLPLGSVAQNEDQLRLLDASTGLDMAIVDLVGDIAAYRPGGKAIILEGGGDSDFDQRTVSRLFPRIQEHANLLSGSNKARVRALHDVLQSVSEKSQIGVKFFSIVDRDGDDGESAFDSVNAFTWDVYHIENYLIEPVFISRVLASTGVINLPTEHEIIDDLRECARETMPLMMRHELSRHSRRILVGALNTSIDPYSDEPASAMSAAIAKSISNITDFSLSSLSEEALHEKNEEIKQYYTNSLADGTWVSKFRGRDILKRFSSKRCPSISYEVFRNLIISQMVDEGYQPAGMKAVVDKIMAA